VGLGTVSCDPAGRSGTCRFTLTGRVGRGAKGHSLAARTVRVRTGRDARLDVRLSRADRRQLAAGRALRLRLTLTATVNGRRTAVHRTIVVKPPRRP
jgi:hypothetical protein